VDMEEWLAIWVTEERSRIEAYTFLKLQYYELLDILRL